MHIRHRTSICTYSLFHTHSISNLLLYETSFSIELQEKKEYSTAIALNQYKFNHENSKTKIP